ncbi:UDP-N-acetylmuramoyl-tripeptide--D-alanyl-D-alanine ligase [Alphaproteobacteria bacterium]|nr:UDP-N-acetylmuramoyl-tripeptide--D-alanyl-D-alanine ligase [Alphaproteobacteria bacterium]
MKNNWTASLLQSITKGTLKGPESWTATTFAHDSRHITKGQLYVAIKGEKVDGHAYIEMALAHGAAAALVEKAPTNLPKDAPLLIVKSVEKALADISLYVRKEIDAKVIAITGSSGKTSTKDMLARCLSDQAKVHATPASFNSRWGLPLTLSQCEKDIDYLVLEMGMNAPGEIENLTKMGRPHIAIITTINPCHIENLGSLENIAREKASLFQGVESGGTALIPADLDQTDLLVAEAKRYGVKNIVLFGEKASAQCRLLSYTPQESTSQIKASIHGKTYTYTLNTLGKHFACNSLAVLGALHAAGANLEKALPSIEAFQGSDGRGQTIVLKDSILLIDESYNANPGSMKAALDSFKERPVKGHRYLVLGQMGELGENAVRYHKELKKPVLAMHPTKVLTYGPLMAHLHKELGSDISTHYESLEQLTKDILSYTKEKDAIFIKGSNALKLSTVSDAIKKKFKK